MITKTFVTELLAFTQIASIYLICCLKYAFLQLEGAFPGQTKSSGVSESHGIRGWYRRSC